MNSILIIDDDDQLRNSFKKLLAEEGYKVESAASGEAGLKIVNNESLDLVILDMRLPGMNGLETFMKLKKLNPDIKVLLSTGYSIDEKAQEMLRQGCRGYILKPYSVIDFSHKLREILEP